MKKNILLGISLVLSASAFGQMDMSMSRYGGPVYNGAPELGVTASVLKQSGPGPFNLARALTTLVGADVTNKEVMKLSKQYSKDRVMRFVSIFNFAVDDAVKIATKAGVKLPSASLSGKPLAAKLVTMGLASDGTFYTEFYLDKLLSHKIHMAVMDDIDKKFGFSADKDYHRIANQAYYDLAMLYKVPHVKLAKLH